MMSNEIIFDYPVPNADVIVDEISKISGLTVILLDPYVNESEVDEEFDDEELHEFCNRIAFKDFPEHMIDIYAYIPDAVNKSVEKEKQETGFDGNWPRPMHGVDEEKGKQSVYIEGHVGMETTLFVATINALETLGGKRHYSGKFVGALEQYPISVSLLKQNHKKVRRTNILSVIIGLSSLPLILPIMLIKLVIGIVKMPFVMRKTYKAVKEHYPEHFEDK